MKVVINACFGGFSLSPKATLLLWERGCKGVDVTHVDDYFKSESKSSYFSKEKSLKEWRDYQVTPPREGREPMMLHVFSPDEQYILYALDIPRDDPMLIAVVEELGKKANGSCASLKIIDVPEGVSWHVEEYDGNEHIAEDHRTWE